MLRSTSKFKLQKVKRISGFEITVNRPISVIPTAQSVVRIFERIIYDQLYTYLIENELLKVVFHSKELFLSKFILWQVTVIFKHADPNDAQKYTNWLCCCHRNVLVYTFGLVLVHYCMH